MLSNKQAQKVKKQHLTWWPWAHKHDDASKMHFLVPVMCNRRNKEAHIRGGFHAPKLPMSPVGFYPGLGSDSATTLITALSGSFCLVDLKDSPPPGPIYLSQSPAVVMLVLPGSLLLEEPDPWAHGRLRTPWNENSEQNILCLEIGAIFCVPATDLCLGMATLRSCYQI